MFGYGGVWTILKEGLVAHKVIHITLGEVFKGLHVTLKAIKQASEFGLNMVALPSHTSHAPSTLICFLL
jgi:hypothetical protein